MASKDAHRLSMDTRKRVTLSKLIHEGECISSFRAYRRGNCIILEPMAEIPADEMWLYEDKQALQSVRRGLSQKGRHDRGSFRKHAQ